MLRVRHDGANAINALNPGYRRFDLFTQAIQIGIAGYRRGQDDGRRVTGNGCAVDTLGIEDIPTGLAFDHGFQGGFEACVHVISPLARET